MGRRIVRVLLLWAPLLFLLSVVLLLEGAPRFETGPSTRAGNKAANPLVAPIAAAQTQTGTQDVVTPTVPLVLTTTLGLDPARCATATDLDVRADTRVYYCYTLTNRSGYTLTTQRITASRLGLVWETTAFTIPHGVTVNTVAAGLTVSETITNSAVITTEWTATAPELGVTEVATATARVRVVDPSLELLKTVGVTPGLCAAEQNATVPQAATVFYCLTIVNSGAVTLTRLTVTDPPLGVGGSFVYTLTPGARLVMTDGQRSAFGLSGSLSRSNVNAAFTNRAVVSATTQYGLSTGSVATATVGLGLATVTLSKTIGTDPEACGTANSLVLPNDSRIYYCLTIFNTGRVTLTEHFVREAPLSIDITFPYVLPPGESLQITNDVLEDRFGLPRLFGPFTIDNVYQTINNTMFYTASSTGGFTAASSTTAFAGLEPTPAPTATRVPNPTRTFTPVPTLPPPATPIPPTPTPTFTPIPPTPTPTPTPTRSFAISALATPTPSSVAGSPLSVPGPEDAAAVPAAMLTAEAEAAATEEMLTAIAAAATATALAQIPTATVTPTATAPPTSSPTLTVSPTATPLPPATATPTAEVIVIVVTNTPGGSPTDLPAAPLIPVVPTAGTPRPIQYPTPRPTPDYVLMAAQILDSAVAAAGWIWFLLGSLVFFAVAGLLAGLSFRQAEIDRFDLYEEPPYDEFMDEFVDDTGDPYATEIDGELYDLTPQEQAPTSPTNFRRPGGSPDPDRPADGEWPANLP